AALQKAIRSLELRPEARQALAPGDHEEQEEGAIAEDTGFKPNDARLWQLLDALRCDAADGVLEALHEETGIDLWFLAKLRNIVRLEQRLAARHLTPALLRQAKRLGFSDRQIAALTPGIADERQRTQKESQRQRREQREGDSSSTVPAYDVADN